MISKHLTSHIPTVCYKSHIGNSIDKSHIWLQLLRHHSSDWNWLTPHFEGSSNRIQIWYRHEFDWAATTLVNPELVIVMSRCLENWCWDVWWSLVRRWEYPRWVLLDLDRESLRRELITSVFDFLTQNGCFDRRVWSIEKQNYHQDSLG